MDRLAELLGRGRPERLHITRIEPQNVADHEPNLVALDSIDDAPRGGSGVGERLLEKNRLARLGGRNSSLLVHPIGQADADRLKSGLSRAAR